MKTKTIFKSAAILFLAALSVNANAQTTTAPPVTTKQSNEKTTALNVVIDNAIEVRLNSVDPLGFRLATAKDFREGKDTSYADHFRVTSNIPYKIEVKTSDATLASSATGKSIPVEEVSLEITNTGLTGATLNKVALSTTNQTLASKLKETVDQQFSVKVGKSTAASSKFLVPGGTYTTNLVITTTQE
ncbi:hypothetical protein SAMN05444008_12355 [Cnuella takakiae]|uniref:CS1 type fimbrial major subunit n=1 Tax=Cnuella takakiae TaxID=1302690 RepID=A0A1M5IEP9_9BACT|nr:hypothetical protein [Cnuella takakiae]OLY90821.1 hypothetical protein BUE76_02090 [Cnuella takakiae]SHG26735.1 hypothetical protein SAMN05444008_12355 [Cnuella takakiae]